MNDELTQQIFQYALFDVVLGAIAWFVLWLLNTRWLPHIGRSGHRAGTWWRQALYGAAFTVTILAITIVSGAVFSGYSQGSGWEAFKYQFTGGMAQLAQVKLMFLLAALFEELIFRVIGVGLLAMLLAWAAELIAIPTSKRLFGKRFGSEPRIGFRHEADSGDYQQFRRRTWLSSSFAAVIVVSAAFGLVHSGNPDVSPIALANIALAGVWLGLLFVRAGMRLWAPWAGHYAWNMVLVLCGLPVSGFAIMPAPLGIGFTGARDSILTGGGFGPEASLPCTVALSIACGWLLWDVLRSERLRRDADQRQAAGAEPDALAS